MGGASWSEIHLTSTANQIYWKNDFALLTRPHVKTVQTNFRDSQFWVMHKRGVLQSQMFQTWKGKFYFANTQVKSSKPHCNRIVNPAIQTGQIRKACKMKLSLENGNFAKAHLKLGIEKRSQEKMALMTCPNRARVISIFPVFNTFWIIIMSSLVMTGLSVSLKVSCEMYFRGTHDSPMVPTKKHEWRSQEEIMMRYATTLILLKFAITATLFCK